LAKRRDIAKDFLALPRRFIFPTTTTASELVSDANGHGDDRGLQSVASVALFTQPPQMLAQFSTTVRRSVATTS